MRKLLFGKRIIALEQTIRHLQGVNADFAESHSRLTKELKQTKADRITALEDVATLRSANAAWDAQRLEAYTKIATLEASVQEWQGMYNTACQERERLLEELREKTLTIHAMRMERDIIEASETPQEETAVTIIPDAQQRLAVAKRTPRKKVAQVEEAAQAQAESEQGNATTQPTPETH